MIDWMCIIRWANVCLTELNISQKLIILDSHIPENKHTHTSTTALACVMSFLKKNNKRMRHVKACFYGSLQKVLNGSQTKQLRESLFY